jgi:hypothetical protein
MAMERTSEPQQFPVFFPGAAPFLDANGAPSGARGATARVTCEINLRPQWLTAIRVMNVYDVPSGFQTADSVFLDKIDGWQTMTTELTVSNIVIREALQTLVMGRDGVLWHPLPTPYPWRGGNSITLEFKRLIGYPQAILPTVHVVLEGIQLVDDRNGIA